MEFNVLKFIADHAGMSIADALTDAYNIGKSAGASESDENDKWIPCSECEKRCDKWENSNTLQQ